VSSPNKRDARDPVWKADDVLEYHARQFREPYRSTIHVGRFLQTLGLPEKADVLDVGCGAGAPISHLATLFPGFRWTGVDVEGAALFPLGRSEMKKRGVSVDFVEGDFYRLRDAVGDRTFDLVLSIQTLPFIPDYRPVLEQLLAVTRDRLVVSCLFTPLDIDARTLMIDYTKPEGVQELHYNTYSLPRFERFCADRGFGKFVSRDFEMDIDLPPQAAGRGTYTRTLADGRRIQFSGPVHLPWKFLAMQRTR
jgi:ubiquinone/menaquinone biosynthesis C-methylase UbiE